MLSIGHDLPFGFQDIPETDRLLALRAAGFDAVMIHWQEADGLGPCERYDRIIRTGLRIRTAHFPQEQTADLWREGEAGDRVEAQMVQALRELGERGIPHLVVHTTRKKITPEPNETGAARFARAVEAAEKYGVNIALENTRFPWYNQYLYDRISSPRLAFCFDCGHAHCFTPGMDPLAMFGDRLVTTHLHDNHGHKDEHLLIGEGTVDLEDVFRRLAAKGMTEYNLETRYRPDPDKPAWSLEEYLEKAFSRLTAHLRQAGVL